MYKPTLLDKPQVLVINKMDTPNAEEKYKITIDMLNNMQGEFLSWLLIIIYRT